MSSCLRGKSPTKGWRPGGIPRVHTVTYGGQTLVYDIPNHKVTCPGGAVIDVGTGCTAVFAILEPATQWAGCGYIMQCM